MPLPEERPCEVLLDYRGKRIKVMLDGKTCIELEDGRITGPGAVGVWSKVDSVTAFDDFAYGGAM